MSEAFQYLDILILAIVAALVLLRLRSVLGRRTGHEKTDTSRFAYEEPQKNKEEDIIKIRPSVNPKPKDDGWFDQKDFLNGASNAYELIVTNFETGNKEALKPFLSDSVMSSFEDVIDQRKANDEKVEFNFIGIESSEVVHKDLKSNPMEVTVRFISEMITCIKNSKDEVISGSLNQVQKITDIWTFAKKKNSKNPNWLLVSTSD